MRLDTIVRNLRYTIRSLRRDSAFTVFVILLAGLGIGASSTVCSVVNTLLLRLAGHLPARRALAIDPMSALRSE